jgi:hypothetical protein
MLQPDEVLPPTFDALTRTTNYYSVPVTGLSKPGSSVIFEGTAAGNIAAEVGSDGRFCADIQLLPNRVNVMNVYTDNNNGKQSQKIQISIEQAGSPPSATTIPQTSQNAALGGSGSTDLSFERNDGSAMIDNNPNTSFGGRDDWGYTSEMTVKLVERSKVNKVTIKAPGDCPFTEPFKLYMSNLDAPSKHEVAPMSWIEVPVTITEPEATATFSTPLIATHFLIEWKSSWSFGWNNINCGSALAGPYYAVSEFEAWTAPGVAPPPPAAPSCLGGTN